MNADNSPVDALVEPGYQLKSIDVTDTPEGSDGTWYRYVIAQGSNEVTGMRTGSLLEVDFAVRDMVLRLNERRGGKSTKKYKPLVEKSAPVNPDTLLSDQSPLTAVTST